MITRLLLLVGSFLLVAVSGLAGAYLTTPSPPLWSLRSGVIDDTPWNNVGAHAPSKDATSGALEFSVPGSGTRAEVEPQVPEFVEGQTLYFGLTYALPIGFPTDVRSWQLITQWKNDGTGSPPLELALEGGWLVLAGGVGHPAGDRGFKIDAAPVVPGQTVAAIIGITFSSDPNVGSVNLWLNGRLALDDVKPPGGTLYPEMSSYWRIGLYRDSALQDNATARLLEASVGTSYDSVSLE